MEFKQAGFSMEFKPVTPAMFLDQAGGIPISTFIEKKVQTMWEKANEAIKDNNIVDEKKDNKDIEFFTKIVDNCLEKVKVKGKEQPLKDLPEDFIKSIGNLILMQSLKLFQKPLIVHHGQAEFIDNMAKRYSKTPIECLCPNGGYTDLDAFMFNQYIVCRGIEKENAEERKQNTKNRMKNNRRK